MAHSASAKKRIRQSDAARSRNRWRKRQIKDSTQAFLNAVHDGDQAKAAEAYRAVTKVLDKVAAKGTIHPKTAARRKSRLAVHLNAMSA